MSDADPVHISKETMSRYIRSYRQKFSCTTKDIKRTNGICTVMVCNRKVWAVKRDTKAFLKDTRQRPTIARTD
jgi:hypothetical protein